MAGRILTILFGQGDMESRKKALDSKTAATGKKHGGGMFDMIYGKKKEREDKMREIEEEES